MVYKSLLRGLLPATCLLCGGTARAALDLCADCAAQLPTLDNACPRCAMPLADAHGAPCGPCLQRAPRFGACIAALRYEHPVRELVSRFKFQGDLACGRMLAGLLARRLAALPPARRTGGRHRRLPGILMPVDASRCRDRCRSLRLGEP